MEAAHILQYTEDEFLQTLDWRPHAKADFHICKNKKDLSIDSTNMPQIEENDGNDDENDKERTSESSPDEYSHEKPLTKEDVGVEAEETES